MKKRLQNMLKQAEDAITLLNNGIRCLDAEETALRRQYWEGRAAGVRAALVIWGEERTALGNKVSRLLEETE